MLSQKQNSCAHAYTPAAISRALQCGVKSIEHGNWLDEATAADMAQRGAFLVPTTVTYDALRCAPALCVCLEGSGGQKMGNKLHQPALKKDVSRNKTSPPSCRPSPS
jgi:imidazolonepropionase-like amidohydrolase